MPQFVITGVKKIHRGSTLIVAILLLLVLSISTLFIAKVGIFEQKTSGSDLRSRIVNQVTTAALNQGLSTFRLNEWANLGSGDVPDSTLWEQCGLADTSFPCGAVPQTVAVNGGNVLRSSYYRYKAGADYDGSGSIDNLEQYMVPLTKVTGSSNRQAVASVGGFNVTYGVGALLCTIDDNSRCTTTAGNRTGVSVVTMVARGSIDGESAVATQVKGFGTYRIFDVPPDTPPIVAGGILEGLGSSTIVANANSGGSYDNSGVNVTVWSRFGIDGAHGSWQTCQAEEYFRDGSAQLEGASNQVVTCSDCSCPADKQDSNGKDGYGPDVLDPRIDADLDQARRTDLFSNAFKAAQSKSFPCDLFEYVFGVRARSDASSTGEEYYPVCEGSVALDDTDGDGRGDAADSYLEANFTEVSSCTSLTGKLGGAYWVKETGSDCRLSGTIGSADHPVLLVVEDSVKPNTSLNFFGLIFIRNPDVTIPQTRSAMDSFDGPGWASGGGNATVYGAVVIDGGGKINGTVNVVGNNQLLKSIGDDPRNRRWGEVAGSWTDTITY